MVSIKDIAKESGYSQATISRLFKGDESFNITDKTKKEIIEVALRLGYERTKIKTTFEKIAILFLVSEEQLSQDMYFRQLRESLEKHARLANMELIFLTKHEEVTSFSDDVTGFIALGPITLEELLSLKKRGYKGVVLEINPAPKYFDTVKPDTDAITKEAIDLFISEGYKKIGFIGGEKNDIGNSDNKIDSREIMFRNYLSSKNLLVEDYIFTEGTFTGEQGYKLAIQMINRLGKNLPQACLIASDSIAVGFLQGLYEKGILIPDDMAIISINNNEISQYLSPPLTTYNIDTNELAKTAINLLSEQLIHPRNISKTVLLGSELIIRKSFLPTSYDSFQSSKDRS